MSDAGTIAQSQSSTSTLAGVSEPGFIRAFYTDKAGTRYVFRFYGGFVSRLAFHSPNDAAPATLYQQPPNTSFEVGSQGPKKVTTLNARGSDGFEVELEIDDTPALAGEFPVQRFRVLFQPPGQPWSGSGRVKPLKGADRIKEIQVNPPAGGGGGGGGVYAMSNGGGSLDVENESETCPPDCDLPDPA